MIEHFHRCCDSTLIATRIHQSSSPFDRSFPPVRRFPSSPSSSSWHDQIIWRGSSFTNRRASTNLFTMLIRPSRSATLSSQSLERDSAMARRACWNVESPFS
eukprot:gb/GECH01011016.1/.p1 GENE.gb/GECH01011016.1/~~gb/GECH01011016.1/.p1  ORF type:complete len:102 (+),score=7.62 gb/GECH01011016.1/:1-306(+)